MMSTQAAYNEATTAMSQIISKSKHYKSTSLKSFVAAMYTADDQSPLRFSGQVGMLQLDFDRQIKSHFLRLYDLSSLKVLFEAELYYGFEENFRELKPNFYIFDYFADGIIGFAFKNKDEANAMAAKIKSVSPTKSQYKELMKSKRQQEDLEKKQSSFLGRFKKRIQSYIHEPQEKQESVVLNFSKQRSISFNPETGAFDCQNLPSAWEQILAKAGVEKADLTNKDVLQCIFQQTLIHQARKAAQESPQLVNELHHKLIQQHLKDEQSTLGADSEDEVAHKRSQSNLPPPPPLLLTPEILGSNPINKRVSTSRGDLMNEIRNNNLRLKPVKTTEKGIQFNPSAMNIQERNDLASHIRSKLQKRKMALNRRSASDDDESSD